MSAGKFRIALDEDLAAWVEHEADVRAQVSMMLFSGKTEDEINALLRPVFERSGWTLASARAEEERRLLFEEEARRQEEQRRQKHAQEVERLRAELAEAQVAAEQTVEAPQAVYFEQPAPSAVRLSDSEWRRARLQAEADRQWRLLNRPMIRAPSR